MLPASVKRSADRAADLIRQAGTPAPTPKPAGNGSDETPDPQADLEKLKKEVERLNTANARLQEKYNAETPRFMSENAALKKRNTELEEAAKKKFESGELSSLSDEERAFAGDDLMKVITKVTREVASGVVESSMRPLREQIDVQQKQSEAVYLATLNRESPGWQTQNDDQNFIAWLNGVDPASGRLRNDILQTAHGAQQGYQTAEIFNAFRQKREIGAQAPRPTIDSPDPGPGAGSPPEPDDSAKGKIYTKADVASFYRDRREGRWKGREKESREIELDIIAANQQGRIRG